MPSQKVLRGKLNCEAAAADWETLNGGRKNVFNFKRARDIAHIVQYESMSIICGRLVKSNHFYCGSTFKGKTRVITQCSLYWNCLLPPRLSVFSLWNSILLDSRASQYYEHLFNFHLFTHFSLQRVNMSPATIQISQHSSSNAPMWRNARESQNSRMSGSRHCRKSVYTFRKRPSRNGWTHFWSRLVEHDRQLT